MLTEPRGDLAVTTRQRLKLLLRVRPVVSRWSTSKLFDRSLINRD
jgi:hypothetical protein